jgi:hypothetical protein
MYEKKVLCERCRGLSTAPEERPLSGISERTKSCRQGQTRTVYWDKWYYKGVDLARSIFRI